MHETVPLIAAFLGGSVMSTLISAWYRWRDRPIISARLDDGFGCYVSTSRGNPPTHQAKFLRLLIENVGRSTLSNCKGYITRITHIHGGQPIIVQQEILELKWSSREEKFLSIPPGAFFYMDIASLDCPIGNSELRLSVVWMPNHFIDLLTKAATFEVDIKITAENAVPLDRKVRFDFDPNSVDLHFDWDPRPFFRKISQARSNH